MDKDRKKKIGIILLLLIILGLLLLFFKGPFGPSGNETKIQMSNNGTTWIHVVMAFENVTFNGTTNQTLGGQTSINITNGTRTNLKTTTFYVDAWIKPNGTETINLSEILGFGSNAIPNGARFPTKIWLSAYAPGVNESAKPKDNMNFLIQGWSMSKTPPSNPKLVTVQAVEPELYNFEFQNVTVNLLPSDITDNKLTITEDPTQFAKILAGMSTNVLYLNVVFLDVDGDFKLIIDRVSLLNLGPITTAPNGAVTINARNPGTFGPNTLCVITA
ncbi:MAG: hypothetical protein HZC47_08240 [Methanobacterium sp.]|uniref:hypothetical protein n=1 Tax=Methanobacterium sp. TaxID=2164 RepID=UPI003D6509E1|nr:hypothetical protein [Methanobacterium sp.]